MTRYRASGPSPEIAVQDRYGGLMGHLEDYPRMVRVPPHSIEAEQSLLGGLMLAPDKIEIIASQIQEDDFYRKDHRAIYRAMSELNLRGQPCDAITLGDWFQANGMESIADPAYLIELANSTPSAANIQAYAGIVKDKSLRRKLIDSASHLVESAYGVESESQEILDRGIAEFMGLQRTETKCEFTLKEAVTLAYAAASDAREKGTTPGIKYPIQQLNDCLGGAHDSDLIIMAGRPASGKTAIMFNFANACGVPCGIISAEQPAIQVGSRFLSIDGRIEAHKMRNGHFDEEDWPKLANSIDRLIGRQCHIYDKSAPNISDVIRIARKWKKQHGIKALWVDYLQRIRSVDCPKQAPKHERVGEVAQKLKDLAKDLNIPVFALAQVKREVERRDDKQPGMDDISDSSEAEKEADQIFTILRPYVYDENEDPEEIIFSLEKNRHGGLGIVRARWLGQYMRVEDRRH